MAYRAILAAWAVPVYAVPSHSTEPSNEPVLMAAVDQKERTTSEQIRCPICDTRVTRIAFPEQEDWQVECENCSEYRVPKDFWDDFTHNAEIRKMSEVLSKCLRNYFHKYGKTAVLRNMQNIGDIQRWYRTLRMTGSGRAALRESGQRSRSPATALGDMPPEATRKNSSTWRAGSDRKRRSMLPFFGD